MFRNNSRLFQGRKYFTRYRLRQSAKTFEKVRNNSRTRTCDIENVLTRTSEQSNYNRIRLYRTCGYNSIRRDFIFRWKCWLPRFSVGRSHIWQTLVWRHRYKPLSIFDYGVYYKHLSTSYYCIMCVHDMTQDESYTDCVL